MSPPASQKNKVAIVGGGLAGLAAGCTLAGNGFQVTVFERRPFLGGRASSYQHPGTGEVVDNCQHVLLGCCTNLIAFYRRLGVEEKIRWYDELTFLEPGGRASVIGSSWLPAPLHTAPAFLGAACLGLKDKLAIAGAMVSLAQKLPADNGETFLRWLKRHGQTTTAIDRFWKTILISALNEDLDRMSVTYAAQVVRESFLKSTAAGRMGVPTVPLTELYGTAETYIRARGGDVRFRSSVEGFRAEPRGVALSIANDEVSFDFVVLAASFDVLPRLLPQTSAAEPLRECLGHFESSPITGIHLWFDRQISELDHAVLLDRTVQWMFHKSRLLEGARSATESPGSYVELVVSSSKSLVEKSRQEIIDLAVKELREFFPGARDANLLKSTVIKEVHATYAPRPGVDAYRPANETVWPRVFLAGDWTATGWPATMEGAVRSGYRAAECVARVSGLKGTAFLQPDLPAAGFMRLLQRGSPSNRQ
ncbi:MAG TPA: hydroxysqualene dehydroxylase HpnE [Terriglobales bacterium]|nr:hydroxysqualene dehydroxylase HpnE [Terriglobales bacterium]